MILLREVAAKDLPYLRAIRADRTMQALLMSHPEMNGEDDTEAWISRRTSDPNGSFYVIAEDHCVGFAQIVSIARSDRHAHFGMGVAKEARGRGVARSALALLTRRAIDQSLHKLMCEVRADNHAALAFYQSVGFRRIGTMIGHYNDNERLHDVVLMEKQLADKQ